MIISDRKQIEKVNKYLGFTDEELAVIIGAAEQINADGELLRLAEKMCADLFLNDKSTSQVREYLTEDIASWNNNLLWTVVYLSGIGILEKEYRRRGIDEQILADSVRDMVLWFRFHKKTTGEFGQGEPDWLWWSFTGKLFRLGRLEFAPERFIGDIEVYRHKDTGEVVCVMTDGVSVNSDGNVNGHMDVFDEDAKQVSYYGGVRYVRAQRTEGEKISNELTYLLCDEYECVLRKGDKILAVHIPQGGKMDIAECDKSFEAAKEFFKKHFDYDFKAFTCWSWLLDPMWSELLGEGTNIRHYRERYTLVPRAYKGDSADVKFFVFEDRKIDLNTATAKTSLQKTILDSYKNGTKFAARYGFMLP